MIFVTRNQIVLTKRPFHFLVDYKKNQLLIDLVHSNPKEIQLSEIEGICLERIDLNKYNVAHYYIQFAVSPKTWCDFYQSDIETTREYSEAFQEMYITIDMGNHDSEECARFVNFIAYYKDIPRFQFVPSSLGKYPGKPKEYLNMMDNSHTSKLIKQQDRRKRISSFLKRLFILLFVLYLLKQLCKFFF